MSVIRWISGSQSATGEEVTLSGSLQLKSDADGGIILYGEATGTAGAPGSGGGLSWSEITTSQTAAVNNGYITNSATLITITLPTTSAIGDVIAVAGKGTGGWKIQGQTGDNIRVGRYLGPSTGYLSSTEDYDSVHLVCIYASDTWSATAVVGNPELG